MKIEFSQEEKNVANGMKTIVENAPVAAVKIGFGILSAGASVGCGAVQSLWGAGKVLVNSAASAIDAYQQASATKVQQTKQETIEVKAEVVS